MRRRENSRYFTTGFTFSVKALASTKCLFFLDIGQCLPTGRNLGQTGGEIAGLPMQKNHSDCSGVAQHALVLGSSDHVESDPIAPAPSVQPAHSAIQLDSTQESVKPKSTCMAP